MISVGDRVLVRFSDHKEKGIVEEIIEKRTHKYKVRIKVFGEDAFVYCTQEQLEKEN